MICSVALLNPLDHLEGKWYSGEQLALLEQDPLRDTEHLSPEQRDVELQERIAKMIRFCKAAVKFPEELRSRVAELEACSEMSAATPYAARLNNLPPL